MGGKYTCDANQNLQSAMIDPNAKCVVNGEKVNEVIYALNPLLKMDIIVGDVAEPTIKYTSNSIQFVLPPSEGVVPNELLDVVDSNNVASSRYFVTTEDAGAAGGGGAGKTPVTSTSPGGKSNGANAGSNRNSLNNGSNTNTSGGRSQLSPTPPAGDASANSNSQRPVTGNASREADARRREQAKRKKEKFNKSSAKKMLDEDTAKRQKKANQMAEDNRMISTHGKKGSRSNKKRYD